MENIDKEINCNNKNFNDITKHEFKDLIIKEIDSLTIYFADISKELVSMANSFDINQSNKDIDGIINNNLNNIKESFETILKKNNLQQITNSLNKIINFNKNENNDKVLNKNNLLPKKTENENEKNEETNKNLITKIKKYKNQKGNLIGYYIKIIFFDNIIRVGPWINLYFVLNLRTVFIKKLSELKLDKNDRKQIIQEFFRKFKKKVYKKYPPLFNNL